MGAAPSPRCIRGDTAPALELPEGLSVWEDEAMLAERVKEWTRLTRPDAFEQIAECVIDAVGAT